MDLGQASSGVQNPGQGSDSVGISPAASLLSYLEYQLNVSTPDNFKALLDAAAQAIQSMAQVQFSPEQSNLMEVIASRLRTAAAMPDHARFSLASLF
jgi:hypothetical protein